MRLKAILSGLFCMLALLVLAGCGNSTSNSGSANDKSSRKLKYWHVASDSFGGQTVRELVADFNKHILILKSLRNLIRICTKA